MSGRPRKGRSVAFAPDAGADRSEPTADLSGLRFTIEVQYGGQARVDYVTLRPRRLALAVVGALRRLAAGPVRSLPTVRAYIATLRKFFAYLAGVSEPIDGPEDLRARHVDGFEDWLQAKGLSRPHLFTLLVKVVAVLREVAAEAPDRIAPELRERLRYTSAKPFERPRPRDALSPFVARQLRDAARADILAIIQRIASGPTAEPDPRLADPTAAAHAVVARNGLLTNHDPEWSACYDARWRRGLKSPDLGERLHGAHHLIAADVVPFLVLLALETGLEIECCKALTVDCLRNAAGGTVEVAYLKRRARGAEHKMLRVRDGGSATPGGLIRQVIALTAPARRHHPSDSLWVYYRAGALVAGVLHPRERVDAWTQAHAILDDQGRPLRLLLSTLRKTHKALWYLKTDGRMTRFAVGHTAEVAARHYADVPALRPLHDQALADAFEEAVAGAPKIVLPMEEPAGRSDVTDATELSADEQDVWLASCSGFYASPFGSAGAPCPTPFWACLECSNAVISARKLPAILGFLAFVVAERHRLSAEDWRAKFGRAHARIVQQILPAFGDAVVGTARPETPAYLPPEVLS
jgi:hypothetical protein